MENQGPGLLECDEELFTRVWDRVTGGQTPADPPANPGCTPASSPSNTVQTPPSCPVDAAPSPASAPLLPAPAPRQLPVTLPVDPTGAALQRWVFRLLNDGEGYHALARRARRERGELTKLGQEKQRQARTLSAEYFLRSGVRYWPQNSLQPPQTLPFFSTLRGFYLTERDRETALRAQAAQEEPELANRYLALADACRAAAHRVRALIESGW